MRLQKVAWLPQRFFCPAEIKEIKERGWRSVRYERISFISFISFISAGLFLQLADESEVSREELFAVGTRAEQAEDGAAAAAHGGIGGSLTVKLFLNF